MHGLTCLVSRQFKLIPDGKRISGRRQYVRISMAAVDFVYRRNSLFIVEMVQIRNHISRLRNSFVVQLRQRRGNDYGVQYQFEQVYNDGSLSVESKSIASSQIQIHTTLLVYDCYRIFWITTFMLPNTKLTSNCCMVLQIVAHHSTIETVSTHIWKNSNLHVNI